MIWWELMWLSAQDITTRPWPYLVFAMMHLIMGQLGAAWLYRARFGGSPLTIYRRGLEPTPHMDATRRLVIPALVWGASLICYALWPEFRQTWQGAPLVELPAWIGWVGGWLSLAGMMWSQASMGRAFQVGQDEAREDAPTLVTSGPFARSRNPVYVFSFLYLVSVTTWAPCPLILTALTSLGWGMHQLVLCEETFLYSQLGESFDEYCRRVPRYL